MEIMPIRMLKYLRPPHPVPPSARIPMSPETIQWYIKIAKRTERGSQTHFGPSLQ